MARSRARAAHRVEHLALVPAPREPATRTVAAWLADGHAAERAGRREEAREAFEGALYAMRGDDATQASATLRWIARTHLDDANYDAAWDCLEGALAMAEAANDLASAGHAMNMQAVVHWRHGDLDEAERLYLSARTRALQARDAKLAAMTAQNLGVLANIRGDFDEAHRHYEASLAEYRALGLPRDVCVALNNLGLLHTRQARWDGRASARFVEARADLRRSRATSTRAHHARREPRRAVGRARRARRRRSGAVAPRARARGAQPATRPSLGQATKLLGRHRARGRRRTTTAEEHFRARGARSPAARQDLLLQRRDRARARRPGAPAGPQPRRAAAAQPRAPAVHAAARARATWPTSTGALGGLEEEFLARRAALGRVDRGEGPLHAGSLRARRRPRVRDRRARADSTSAALFWFRIGALLHDVGKLVDPAEVLNKPGKLTDEEWALMRSHTTAGVEMLADIEFPWDVRPIVAVAPRALGRHGLPARARGRGRSR